MSLSGVQPKASMRINPKTHEMEIVTFGGTHILKPESDKYSGLAVNENACMNIASELDMTVPPHGLFQMKDGTLCYIVKRFDRKKDGGKIHKETLFQILNSKDKYSGSLEQVGRAIRAHTKFSLLDALDFFERVVLSFLIANGDMHLKNWALLLDEEIGWRLSPCYDFVCTRIYLRDSDSALTINGKNNMLERKDFDAFGTYLELDPKAIENSYQKFAEGKSQILEMVDSSEMTSEDKNKFQGLMRERYERVFD